MDPLLLSFGYTSDFPIVKQLCRCSELIRQACDTIQSLADSAQLQLHYTLTDCTFWADPDLIVQVLTNLLSNSIKFFPPYSSIHLSTQVNETELLIAIQDHGTGIPADKLELIFGRFQQVDASDSRKKGGTGLGLAICRQIIQQHQGRIWAESRLGEGSTFYVALPLRESR
ncbi:MAG: ATP-binding protein [Thermostichus sp. DG02_5_bins_236]